MKTEREPNVNLRTSSAILALALTLLLAACARPDTVADEAGAIGALETLAISQRLYSKEHYGAFGTFDQLIRDTGLSQKFAGGAPLVGGYVFSMKVVTKAAAQPPFFSINADPQGSDGKHFYIDPNVDIVRVNDHKPAGPDDPTVSQE